MNPQNLRPHQPGKSALALLSAFIALSSGTASAAIYQWRGSVDSAWSNASNWDSVGVAQTGGTFGHRLNINNGAANEAVYTAALGTTVYTVSGNRGLVIGSGNLGNGTFRITGGKFSTVGAGANDAIGNGTNTATLIVDGGEYETGRTLDLGLTYGSTSTLTVNNGTATVPDISTNNAIGNINLNGGTLAMNRFVHVGGGNTFLNFNGGTLRARMSTTAFYPVPAFGASFAVVKAGGAVIDTNGFDITLARPLEEDPTSTGGGLTKTGAGTLTLGAPSTVTGPVTINGGGLGVTASAGAWRPASLTHSGTALNLNLGVYAPTNEAVIDVPVLTLNSTDITLNISGSSIPVSSEIKILDYGTKSGTGSLKLNTATLPANMVATLEENTVDGYYYLNVTSPSATTFTWSGATATPGSGQWDASSLNWNAASSAYAPPALVNFPNITGGGTVEIVSDAAPVSIGIDNAAGNPYTFSGSGKITGATGIVKNGTGIAIFDGAAHTFGGPLAINSGAVIKRKADDTTGGITVASDNVTFVLDGGISDGAGQTLTVSGRGSTTSGYFFTGSAVQRGALQSHNGANTWQGDIVLALNDFNSPNRIGVQNGASLTLTGGISESVAGASVVFRGGAVGDNITLAGPTPYTYTGRSLIFTNGGSVILGANNKLPIASAAVLDSGGATIFDLNGYNQQVASLGGSASGDAARILNNNASTPSTLTVSPAAGTTGFYQGRLADGAGVLSLVMSGPGTQILVANQSYTGSTTINGGTLQLGDGNTTGTLLPASQIITHGTLAINRNNTATQGNDFANGISGSGRLLKSGAGTVVLTSANTYAGATVVTAGTLALTGEGTVGSGQVSLASGSTFDVTAATPAIVVLPGGLAGSGTVTATSKTLSIGGSFAPVALAVSGNVSLAPGASTTLVAGASPAATSTTTVSLGSLVNNGALSIVAASGFTFASGDDFTFFSASGGITAGFTSVSVGTLALSAESPGVWTGSADGLAYTYTESSGTLAVTTASVQLTALQTWRQQYFGSPDNTGNGADNADFDRDGLVNLFEYALGTDPAATTSGPVVVARSGNVLTLTYPRRSPADPALVYTVQGGSDLAAGFSPATGNTTQNGSIYTYTDDVDLDAPGTRRFLRLSVTYTPAP
ncbi:MAG: autotransporter-associated beta strand repeat-containing protein [Opitutaceae bacterium]|nr:autotransporter-associated beta strand repeat-containing protein [Opitutaceae bacterium]